MVISCALPSSAENRSYEQGSKRIIGHGGAYCFVAFRRRGDLQLRQKCPHGEAHRIHSRTICTMLLGACYQFQKKFTPLENLFSNRASQTEFSKSKAFV